MKRTVDILNGCDIVFVSHFVFLTVNVEGVISLVDKPITVNVSQGGG